MSTLLIKIFLHHNMSCLEQLPTILVGYLKEKVMINSHEEVECANEFIFLT